MLRESESLWKGEAINFPYGFEFLYFDGLLMVGVNDLLSEEAEENSSLPSWTIVLFFMMLIFIWTFITE